MGAGGAGLGGAALGELLGDGAAGNARRGVALGAGAVLHVGVEGGRFVQVAADEGKIAEADFRPLAVLVGQAGERSEDRLGLFAVAEVVHLEFAFAQFQLQLPGRTGSRRLEFLQPLQRVLGILVLDEIEEKILQRDKLGGRQLLAHSLGVVGEEPLEERVTFPALDGAHQVVPPGFAPVVDRVFGAGISAEHGGDDVAESGAMGGLVEAGFADAETEKWDHAGGGVLAGFDGELDLALAEAGEDPLDFRAVERGAFGEAPCVGGVGWLAGGEGAQVVDEERVFVLKPIDQTGVGFAGGHGQGVAGFDPGEAAGPGADDFGSLDDAGFGALDRFLGRAPGEIHESAVAHVRRVGTGAGRRLEDFHTMQAGGEFDRCAGAAPDFGAFLDVEPVAVDEDFGTGRCG